MAESQAMQSMMNSLQRNDLVPEIIIHIEEFAAEKSSQSFGNTALEYYKKLGTKAPIISIENPPAGLSLSTGEDLEILL